MTNTKKDSSDLIPSLTRHFFQPFLIKVAQMESIFQYHVAHRMTPKSLEVTMWIQKASLFNDNVLSSIPTWLLTSFYTLA